MKFLFQGETVILYNVFSTDGTGALIIEISFKFIPKILMSKECIHFFGPLCIFGLAHVKSHSSGFRLKTQ